MTLETVRLDESVKRNLAILKRRTGIDNWNVLCRWAFCLSVAQPTPTRDDMTASGSAIEMTWKTFGGEYANSYLALLRHACNRDYGSTEPSVLHSALRAHIARGAAYLISNRSISSAEQLLANIIDSNRNHTAA